MVLLEYHKSSFFNFSCSERLKITLVSNYFQLIFVLFGSSLSHVLHDYSNSGTGVFVRIFQSSTFAEYFQVTSSAFSPLCVFLREFEFLFLRMKFD